MMAFCTQCGKQLDDATRFCPICGAPAAQDGPDTAQQTPPQQAAAPAGGQTWNQNPYVNPEQMDVNNNKGYAILSYFSLLVLIPIFCRERFQIRTLPRQPGAGAHDIRSDILGCRRDCDRDFMAINWWLGSIFSTIFRAGGTSSSSSSPFSASSPRRRASTRLFRLSERSAFSSNNTAVHKAPAKRQGL